MLTSCENDMVERSKDWLNQAERDIKQAEASLREEFYEWACFAAQQASGKSVKASGTQRKLSTVVKKKSRVSETRRSELNRAFYLNHAVNVRDWVTQRWAHRQSVRTVRSVHIFMLSRLIVQPNT